MGAEHNLCYSNPQETSILDQNQEKSSLQSSKILKKAKKQVPSHVSKQPLPTIYEEDLSLDKKSMSLAKTDQTYNQQNPSERFSVDPKISKDGSEKVNGESWQDYNIIEKIGQGCLGQVFACTLKDDSTHHRYAIKRIDKFVVKSKKLSQSITIERKVLSGAQSLFVANLKFYFSDKKYHYFVMDQADCDIYSFIQKESSRLRAFRKIGEEAIRFILANIILGLEDLHRNNVIYCDLKPENILIFKNGYTKLTDFGLSKITNKGQKVKVKLGSPLYVAPEISGGLLCGPEVDLWALGIMAHQLANLEAPFSYEVIMNKDMFSKMVKLRENKKIYPSHNMSLQLTDLIQKLLKLDPSERLGANSWQDIKSHPFFTGVNFEWEKIKTQTLQSPLLQILKEKKVTKKQKATMESTKNSVDRYLLRLLQI